MSMKTNKFGEVTCAKYTTATPRVALIASELHSNQDHSTKRDDEETCTSSTREGREASEDNSCSPRKEN
jgi:hypothetical protein